MSSYVNSEGVVRESWKGSENNGKVIGYNGPSSPNTKKPSYLQRMFGTRKHNTSGLNNLVKRGKATARRNNNGQVPKYTFNTTKEFGTLGYVQKNTGETLQTRMGVFQQNFIKRIYAQYQDVKLGKIPLNLEAYATQLENETDEASAILLYNELILLYIIVCIDCIERLLYSNPDIQRKILEQIKISKREFTDLQEIAIALGPVLAIGLTASSITLVLTPVGIGAVAMGVGWYIIWGIFITLASTMSSAILTAEVVSALPLKKRKIWEQYYGMGRISTFNSDTVDLSYVDMFNTINVILFSETNPVKITDVKDKLKYWGLLQTQVDYMFDVGHSPQKGNMLHDNIRDYLLKIIKFFRDNENRKLAPNEPLSEEQLKAAYPKPPLAGNPFANASTLPSLPPPPNVPLKSMTGGRTRRRVHKKRHLRK